MIAPHGRDARATGKIFQRMSGESVHRGTGVPPVRGIVLRNSSHSQIANGPLAFSASL